MNLFPDHLFAPSLAVERQIEKENSETQKIPEDETTPKFNSQAGLSSSTIVFETNEKLEDKTPPISKNCQAGPSSFTIVSETHKTPEDKAPPISNSQRTKSSWTQVAVYRKLILSPEHKAALLKSGSDEETIESSEALTIGNNRVELSNAARQRFKYLMKQGPPAEEARVKSVEPVRKKSTFEKGLNGFRSETKTLDGQPKKNAREADRGSIASMPTEPTFNQVTGGVNVGILLKN
ncbi:hypothetical protein JTB14_037416 [Gonioctena quinquepunctata]|nr:hypothetical protein JTB14_037416 [Gonioctena quinquepunctata]